MGGKSVINFVLILVLVVALNQVEAVNKKTCYDLCRFRLPKSLCASICGCTLVDGRVNCPSGYSTPQNSEEEVQEFVGDYCKFKCASSICNTILHASAEKEPCYNACSQFCKDSVVTNVA